MSAVVHIFRFSRISFPRNSLDFTTVPSAVCLLVEGPSEVLATLRLSFSCFFPSSVPFAFKMVLHRVKTHEIDTVIAKEAEQHSSISIEIAVELLSLLLGCEAGYWSTYFSFLCQCCGSIRPLYLLHCASALSYMPTRAIVRPRARDVIRATWSRARVHVYASHALFCGRGVAQVSANSNSE